MKKLLILATALTSLAITAGAAPLDPKGIPADAQGIVHIDLDCCAKSTLGDALKQLSEKALLEKSARQEDYENFKKQTGIDPAKDISGITIGLFKNNGAGTKAPNPVVIVRGTFSPEKLVAAAKENNCPVTTRGTLTLIEASDIAAGIRPGDSDEDSGSRAKSQKFHAAIADKNTIFLAETLPEIDRTAAAFSGKAESYTPPATLGVFGGQDGAPMVLAYVARELVGGAAAGMPLAKPESALFSIVEKGANLHARVYSEYTSPEAARKTQAAVQMMIGFLQLGAANSATPDAEENARDIQRLIDSLKMNVNDKNLDITAHYPVADLIELVKKHSGEE